MKQITLFLILVLWFSCSDENTITENNEEQLTSLVEYEMIKLTAKSAEEIKSELSRFGGAAILLRAKVKFGIEVYRLKYKSAELDSLSGVIMVPIGAPNPSVISFQHGTVVAQDEVSSVAWDEGEGIMQMFLASNGFVISAADYFGLGVSQGVHSFVIEKPLAEAVVENLVRAVDFLEREKISYSEKLYLLGYSEGGYATMAAQKIIEENGVADFKLLYSAPMAGPYDLSATMQNLMYDTLALASPYFLPYTIAAYTTYYGQDSLRLLLQDSIAEPLLDWFSGNYSGSELNEKLPNSSLNMFVVGARQSLQASIFDSLLKTNDVYKFYPSTKTDLIHCQQDTYVPIANSKVAFTYMSAGSDMVSEKYLENGDHIECIFAAFLAAFTEVENLDE
jgi:hypothetical protein